MQDLAAALCAAHEEIRVLRAAVAERDAAIAMRDRIIVEREAQITALTKMGAAQAQAIAALTMPAGGCALTVRQVYDRFEPAHRGSKSWKHIRNRLRAFLIEFGEQPAMTVTPPKWAAFRERRKVADEQLGAAVAPLTINFELDWAKRMFSWATEPEQALLPANPLENAKREKVDDKRETWLTEEQIAKLLAHCGPVVAAFVLIAVDSGKRISEVVSIRKDRMRYVDLTDGRKFAVADISKRRTKSKRPDQAALTPRCLEALSALPEPAHENPFILPSPKKKGSPYSVRQIARLFRAACVAAGVDVFVADGDGHIRAHDLRHSAATAAARRGATLPQVQTMLGHSSPSITARYVHLGEEDILAVAQIQDIGSAEERRGPRRVSPTVFQKKLHVV